MITGFQCLSEILLVKQKCWHICISSWATCLWEPSCIYYAFYICAHSCVNIKQIKLNGILLCKWNDDWSTRRLACFYLWHALGTVFSTCLLISPHKWTALTSSTGSLRRNTTCPAVRTLMCLLPEDICICLSLN